MFLKNAKSFKTYLLFLLCAFMIIGASVFYFKTSDTKKNTSTIIFSEKTTAPTTQPIKNITDITTSKAIKSTTSARNDKTKITTTAVTEEIYIDINSAGATELTKLKGIGEVLADEIISYRENSGGFRNIEEIMNVNGIGEKIFADIRDHIFVIDPVYDEEVQENENITDTEQMTEYIPTFEELAPIDINTADIDTLTLLPHVDEDIANRIIDFREHTKFQNVYELLLINGLSQNDVGDIVPYVTT